MSAAVAAGDPATVDAAAAVLAHGGSAVDAAVAGALAACVAEPGLASLGGGGFLLSRPAVGEPVLVDFFVAAPGLGRAPDAPPARATEVTVRFAATTQPFHVGPGSVAVPGALDGLLHAHRRFGRQPLADVVAPAVDLARRGVALSGAQSQVLGLLQETMRLTPEAARLYLVDGGVPQPGDVHRNADLAGLLEALADGSVRRFADLAAPLAQVAGGEDSALTAADLTAYQVVERTPLSAHYRGALVLTNPLPAFGGSLLLHALARLAEGPPFDESPPAFVRLAEALVAISDRRLIAGLRSARGTTHISVVDEAGDTAAVTVSNGSCSGVVVPGTGIQLNNVMGELDLHPEGSHTATPGTRIGSMMAPTVVVAADGSLAALGSGGSERIRSAMTQVTLRLLDVVEDATAAVLAPRLHWDGAALQAEPGLGPDVLAALAEHWPVAEWPDRDLYFGGVHVATRDAAGGVAAAGDPRRDGAARVVPAGGGAGAQ